MNQRHVIYRATNETIGAFIDRAHKLALAWYSTNLIGLKYNALHETITITYMLG